MALADDMQQRVAAHQAENLEYVRDDYQLSLNPIPDRHNELAFVLWRGTDRTANPLYTGRAKNGRLQIDRSPEGDIDVDRVEALIAWVLAGEEQPEPVVGSPETTLPQQSAAEVEHQ